MPKPRMIFHVPFPLKSIDATVSGSSKRPVMMLQAFVQQGFEVDVVSGYKKERLHAIKEIKRKIKQGQRYAFLYSESSTMPTCLTEPNHIPFSPTVDFGFFKFLKKQKIEIILFYRDIYWRFAWYRKSLPFVKWLVIYLFSRLDLFFYEKYVDQILLPSLKMKFFLTPKLQNKVSACPPGHALMQGAIVPSPQTISDLRFLYVGGVIPPCYDVRPLFSLAKKFHVVVSCREAEWKQAASLYGSLSQNCVVYHKYGKALEALFERCHVFAILRKSCSYLDFAMPLKLFEAIGHGMPILTTRGTAIADFVEQYSIGWTTDEALTDLDGGKIISEYQQKIENIRLIQKDHTWEARVKGIIEHLEEVL